jgi:hypothetical protein
MHFHKGDKICLMVPSRKIIIRKEAFSRKTPLRTCTDLLNLEAFKRGKEARKIKRKTYGKQIQIFGLVYSG